VGLSLGEATVAITVLEKAARTRTDKLGPDDRATLATVSVLATAYDQAGRMDKALPLYIAARQAWFGQERELAATCEKALRFAGDTKLPALAERAAKVCCLRPLTEKDREAVLSLARRAVELGKENPGLVYFQMTLGMAEYRAGHFAAADQALGAAMRAGANNVHANGTSAFYLAMSRFRQRAGRRGVQSGQRQPSDRRGVPGRSADAGVEPGPTP
jgi:hypothetical protein